jgi:hypothetical protein
LLRPLESILISSGRVELLNYTSLRLLLVKKEKKTLKKSQPFKESEEDEDIEDDKDYSNEDDDEEEENKPKQKKQKRGNEIYLEYLDSGNLKNTPNKKKKPNLLPHDDDKPTMPHKTKKPNLLPDNDDEPIELSTSAYREVKPTISPVKLKNEKMGNEVEITKKEQKQEKDDFERIRQEIEAQIGAQLETQLGEFMKLYMRLPAEMKVPAEQPKQEIKEEN